MVARPVRSTKGGVTLYARTGTAKRGITVGGVRQSSGTESEEDAKDLGTIVNHSQEKNTVTIQR